MLGPPRYVTFSSNVSLFGNLATGSFRALGTLKSDSQAAASIVWAALLPGASSSGPGGAGGLSVSGQYIEDCNVSQPSRLGSDDVAAQLLHQVSCVQAGLVWEGSMVAQI